MNARRRLVLALGAGALTAPWVAIAQPKGRVYRVGLLAAGSQLNSINLYDAFANGLRDLGYVEGKNLVLERRFAGGKLDTLPALAAELAVKKLDVIFAPGSPAVRAVKEAAESTPIVFAVVNDPVERGFVASLTKPGGRITGVTSVERGLSVTRLHLLKEAFPRISHVVVAIAREPSVAGQVAAQIGEVTQAAKTNGMQVLAMEIRSRNSFGDASEVLRKWRADGMSCLDSAGNFYNRDVLTDFAAKTRLPAIYTSREYVDAGGLMSYGANAEANYRRAAGYVDKILKGAQPADLPVETPTKFELALNGKTAKALGITFPSGILEKADRIIE